MNAVELFAGAGGLGMGVGLAGFVPLAVLEWDRWACDTIRENQRRAYPLVDDWPLWPGDVREFDWSTIREEVDLVSGGPPCQPFSLGGKHRAFNDERDMFPATVDVVRRLRPKAFIVENVKGLTRSAFHNYFEYIKLQFEFPERPRRRNEDWYKHYLRLQAEHHSGNEHGRGLTYRVSSHLVNAANYGVPQRRERVFIVGFRYDLQVEWAQTLQRPPAPSEARRVGPKDYLDDTTRRRGFKPSGTKICMWQRLILVSTENTLRRTDFADRQFSTLDYLPANFSVTHLHAQCS